MPNYLSNFSDVKDGDCIQTITHPAISVWSVAVCVETGDIVSGASDRLVRVFSRDQIRWADEQTLKVRLCCGNKTLGRPILTSGQAFDDTVAASSIPA